MGEITIQKVTLKQVNELVDHLTAELKFYKKILDTCESDEEVQALLEARHKDQLSEHTITYS